MEFKTLQSLRKMAGMSAPAKPVEVAQEIPEIKESTSARYDSSEDFESDVETIKGHLNDISLIMRSERWHDWVKATDDNFDHVDAVSQSVSMSSKVRELQKKFDNFYTDMVNADGNIDGN